MRRLLPVLLSVFAMACDGGDTIARWDLFEDPAAQAPRDDVIPYAPVSPLFSDYAEKHRFVRLPPGTQITYTEEGDWIWPPGTVLVKTFGFLNDRRDPSAGERLIETRLLVLEDDGAWRPYIYRWNEDGTDAERIVAGARVPVSWIHDDGSERSIQYRIPNEVQCANCHGGARPLTPIGPRTDQLHWAYDYGEGPVNQIDHLTELGLLAGATDAREALADPMGEGDVDARARAYLDANCAHCHQEGGAAAQSGLWLNAHVTEPITLGICKPPVAAGAGAGGRDYDIVPGAPEESVMVYRMESEEAGIRMPELGVAVSHAEGVALIREWIAAMEPTGCE